VDKPVSQHSVGDLSRQLAFLSCIVIGRYLATTCEQMEDFMCAVVVVMYRV
jgi:hypothetical protein